jgi:hypothetical protein
MGFILFYLYLCGYRYGTVPSLLYAAAQSAHVNFCLPTLLVFLLSPSPVVNLPMPVFVVGFIGAIV